ncbi:PH domain-containing protein [Planomicrobium sp. CPCC 101079]|uniref:PH domain-containing protein n=1 Tax=Planomicrobium sp. CPCC 101079 TaxID=2599618 RepID=UPI0011B5D8D9|nr:PH domain-containing protein [Planomicrobium sp. CPCC 101079]TWT02546.1 PH domain-containing protein [Planomicrobium sp. CPCC 101079]
MSEMRYKLHPISAFLNFIKGLRELIFPFIIIFGVNLFRGGGESIADRGWQGLIPVLIGGVVLIFMLISGLIKWHRFVYWFEEGELRIEYGLFVKKKRYIPFERIQSLDYTEGIFHRPLGLVKVKVETAGTGKIGQADVELTAIPREDAERIEKKMEYAKRHNWEPILEAGEAVTEEVAEVSVKAVKTVYRMSLKELIILATTSGGIGVVISAVAVFLSQFSDLIPYDAIYQEVILFLRFGYLIVALTIFLILLLAWVISIILAIFANYQFTISTDEDHIYISRGLLEKKKVSVPFKRIQGIQISQNPLREWFGYATVTVESAGGTLGDKDEKIRLFPLARKTAIFPILSELFPDMEWEPVMKKAPKRSVHFFYRLDFFWMIPVAGLVSYFFYPYGLFSLLIFPIVILFAVWQHRTAGYALTRKQLTMEFRTVSKHAFFMMKKRIQAIEVTQSYFQRRKNLASIQATIKSGMLGAAARVDHMEEQDASEVLAWYEPSDSKAAK